MRNRHYPTPRRHPRCSRLVARAVPLTLFALVFAGLAHAQTLFVSLNGGGTIDQVSSTGVVSGFASGLTHPNDIAFDAAGNLFVAQSISGSLQSVISEVTPDGVVHPFATGLQNPLGLAFDASGNLFVTDYAFFTISEVTPDGVVHSFASGLNSPFGLAFDASGNLFVANRDNGTVSKVTTAGTVSLFASGFNQPNDLTFGPGGNLFVSNFGNSTISEVTPGGSVSTFVDGTQGLSAPVGLAYDSVSQNLFVASQGASAIFEVTPGGVVSTFATFGGAGPQYLDFAPATVPEPSVYGLLFGLGAVALASAKRRHRQT